MKVSPARSLAYDTFLQVMYQGKNPDAFLQQYYLVEKVKLKQIDRNFVKELVYGSLRWYSKIRWILQNISKRDLDDCAPEVVTSLVMGGYQIFYLDRVPDRAAVNESVEYVRARNHSHAVGFVNGILRTASRRSQYFPKPDKTKSPAQYFALQYAHPEWVVRRWVSRFKPELLKEIFVNNNRPPVQALRVNSLQIKSEDLKDFRTKLLRDSRLHTERCSLRSCLTVSGNFNPHLESYFAKGLYSVQGQASQLVAEIVGPQPGEFIVDACCGRGGKMSHLFELSGGEAQITGIDPEPQQLKLAKTGFERLGFNEKNLHLKKMSFLDFEPGQAVDKVLLDAPCSGLGVIRRHPEGKWNKNSEVVQNMQNLQRELLAHAFKMLKVGGTLVYSVCSFEPEETAQQMSWLREEFSGRVEIQRLVGKVPDYYRRYFVGEQLLLIYPSNKDDMDGFGAFAVRKIA